MNELERPEKIRQAHLELVKMLAAWYNECGPLDSQEYIDGAQAFIDENVATFGAELAEEVGNTIGWK